MQITGGGEAVDTRVQMNANVLLPASVCTYIVLETELKTCSFLCVGKKSLVLPQFIFLNFF